MRSTQEFRQFLQSADGDLVLAKPRRSSRDGRAQAVPNDAGGDLPGVLVWAKRHGMAIAAGAGLMAALSVVPVKPGLHDAEQWLSKLRLEVSHAPVHARRAQAQPAKPAGSQVTPMSERQIEFLRNTEAHEGYGVTTITFAHSTGVFAFRGQVDRIEAVAGGAILYGTSRHGLPSQYRLAWRDLLSGRLLLTISGIQFAACGEASGVTLEAFAKATGIRSPTIEDFLAMAVHAPEGAPRPAQPGGAHELVNRVFSKLYWRPEYDAIQSERTAMIVADMGVNLGMSNQAAMLRHAMAVLGKHLPASATMTGDLGARLINAVDQVRLREALAVAVARHYAWLAAKDPVRYGANLEGWMNRAISYSNNQASQARIQRLFEATATRIGLPIAGGLDVAQAHRATDGLTQQAQRGG